MNKNDPFAKLGGGALDQELFKSKPTPPPAQTSNASSRTSRPVKAKSPSPLRQAGRQQESKFVNNDVVTSSLHNVNFRSWRDTIENTETHNSSLRITKQEGHDIEDLLKDLERNLKIKSSLNELARLGLLYLLHDFKKNREQSLVYKVKKS
jgi:hypothetical protein